jgi:hypothetical protein
LWIFACPDGRPSRTPWSTAEWIRGIREIRGYDPQLRRSRRIRTAVIACAVGARGRIGPLLVSVENGDDLEAFAAQPAGNHG